MGVLRAWDNVDGLFGDYVGQAFRDYLARQSRFVAIDGAKVDSVLTSSKIPYNQLIEDPKILQQAARSLRAETLLRTKVIKEGPRYRFTIDWMLAPQMEILASETFQLEQPTPGKAFSVEELKLRLQSALEQLIKKIPIRGHVTGRDERALTLNLGRSSELRRGDTVTIATLEEVKRHPLLKTIVDWRFENTGKARVEKVEDALSFATVIDETPERQIARYQKVVAIEKGPEESKIEILTGDEAKAKELAEPPKNGWLEGTLWLGSLSRAYSASATSGKNGSGFLIGAKGEAQIWLTREWFGELMFAGGSAGYSQTDLSTGAATAAGSVNASLFRFRIDGGYTFFTSVDLFGPRGWVKAGFQSTSYRFPLSTAEQTSANSVSGLFIGVGGDLPIDGPIGAAMNFDFGLINSASDDDTTAASISGASSVDFYLGGYYRVDRRMLIRLGLGILAQGADFSSGANFSQKVLTFGPSLVYYF